MYLILTECILGRSRALECVFEQESLRSSFWPANILRIFLALGLNVHILFIFSWVRTRAAGRGPVVAITAARKGGVNWTKDSQSNTLFLMILC